MHQIEPTRWFSTQHVEKVAEQLMAEVADAGLNQQPKNSQRYSVRQKKSLDMRTYFFLAAVAIFFLAVLFGPDFLPGEWLAANGNLNRVVTLIMIAVPVGFGVAAKKRLMRANQRIDAHDSCVKKLVDQFPDLCCTNAAPINSTSVNTLPLMETGCQKNNLRCGMFGQYKGQALTLLEAEYIAPRGIDAAEFLAKAQAELAGDVDREQFSRVRSGEAIVFFAPLRHIPDVLICGIQEPLCGYQKQWIRKSGNQPKDCEIYLGENFRGFSSCRESAGKALNEEFFDILKLRPKAMVQVIGGYVVIIPRTWSAATPMDMAVTAFDIQLDLDFSCALYEILAIGTSESKNSANCVDVEMTV